MGQRAKKLGGLKAGRLEGEEKKIRS